ncbi:MAG: hypothetical protein DRQ51_10640 [Gammaproteobacteria bacterium]|nr:MAG: hypothetical protein DRQ51_10640 [Gammaproteobacteria bacterium]
MLIHSYYAGNHFKIKTSHQNNNSNYFRIRIRKYRIVYEIFENSKTIEIVTILKRGHEYRNL